MAEYSERALGTLQGLLQQTYAGARQTVLPAAGGFIVGLVDPRFGAVMPGQDEFLGFMKALGPVNASIPNAEDRIVIFSLRFYAADRDAYNTRAALRVRATSWDASGASTHYASAQDAYLLAHEVDAEAMLTDPQSHRVCRVIRDDSIQSLAVSPSALPYAQFDLEGEDFGVERVEDAGEGVWKVYVR